jgi:glycosyltransferase involved in cell wall biosynthesis
MSGSNGSRRGLRLLVTVTFNDNQLRSHLLPLLALEEVEEIVLVADKPAPPLPRVRTVVPPSPLVRMIGRAAAKLVVCSVVAVRERPDWVIGYHVMPHGLNAYISSRIARTRALYHQIGGPKEWEEGGWESDNSVVGRLRRPSASIERVVLGAIRRMDAVATMGPDGRKTLIARGLDPRRVVVVPPALDPDRIRPPAEARKDYDVITVGQLIPRKRIEDLLAAVAKLRDEGRPVRAAVVGTGSLQRELESRARELGVADLVSFLGFRSDVGDLCARARVFVLPSRREGLSIALLDAMASGLPAVASDVGEARAVVEDGVTGYLYPCADIDALAQAIRRLLDDDALCRRLGDAARERVEEIASVERVAQTLRGILGSETGAGRRRAVRTRSLELPGR